MTTTPIQTTILPSTNWSSPILPTTDAQRIARAHFDLPIDQPIVASGHQPILFHPGIVAKLIALDHLARTHNAHPVWIVPDQDTVDPALVHFPQLNNDVMTLEPIRLAGDQPITIPAALHPAIEPNTDLPDQLAPIAEWIAGYTYEPSLAKQFSSAIIGYLCQTLDLIEPTLIYATDILSTDPAMHIVETMFRHPSSVAATYNDHVSKHPDARVAPLTLTHDTIELPLWALSGSTRTKLTLPFPIQSEHPPTLAPRGLLLTALVRAHLADLFIHGTGGFIYDRISESWFKESFDTPLAPMGAVSATMTPSMMDLYPSMDLPGSPDHLIWKAHHAKHTPKLLEDPAAQSRKDTIIQELQGTTSKHDRARLFAELHTVLETSQSTHASVLTSHQELATLAKRSRDHHAILNSRTHPFVLFHPEHLAMLKGQVIADLDPLVDV